MKDCFTALLCIVVFSSGLVMRTAAQTPTEVEAATQSNRTVSIADAAWLAGRWVGEGFDGQMEETWAPPVGGQMIGHFRYWREDQPQFYELLLLDVIDEGLRMRVKHFGTDMVGWEEKDDWITFEPVSVEPDALLFNGLEIRRVNDERIVISLRMRHGDTVKEEIIRLTRAPL